MLRKCTIFTEKFFRASLKVSKKKTAIKMFENCAPLCVFLGIMQIMCSEPNYAISHPRIIREVLFRIRHAFRWNVLRARDKEEGYDETAEDICRLKFYTDLHGRTTNS